MNPMVLAFCFWLYFTSIFFGQTTSQWANSWGNSKAGFCRNYVELCKNEACNRYGYNYRPNCYDFNFQQKIRECLRNAYNDNYLNMCYNNLRHSTTTTASTVVYRPYNPYYNSVPAVTPGKSCRKTVECDPFQMCRGGKCWKSKIPQYRCYSNQECPNEHYKCIDYECKIPQESAGVVSNTGRIPLPSPGRTCWSTNQCDSFQMCRQNRCWPSNIRNEACSWYRPCPMSSIYSCVDSRCVISGQPGKATPLAVTVTRPATTTTITTTTTTTTTTRPTTTTTTVKTTTSAIGKVGCKVTKTDCPQYHTCRDNICWKSQISGLVCKNSADCPNKNVYECLSSQCKVSNKVVTKTTTTRPTVPTPTTVKSTTSAIGKVGCKNSLTDCPQFHTCRSNKCWKSQINGLVCASADDCPDKIVYQCIKKSCKVK